MSSRVWSTVVVAVAGLLAAGATIALVLSSDHEQMKAVNAVATPAIGLGFVATGLFARWRRPGNPTGGLMALVGFLWLGGTLVEANAPGIFAVGGALSLAFIAGLTHLLLAFPGGHLRSRRERALVSMTYVVALGHPLTQMLLKPRPFDRAGDPRNVLLVSDQPTLAGVVDSTWAVIGIAALALVIREIVLRWKRSSVAQRRGLTLVSGTGAVVLGGLALTVAAQSARLPSIVSGLLGFTAQLAFLALPSAFLAGLLRARYSRAAAVDDQEPAPAGR